MGFRLRVAHALSSPIAVLVARYIESHRDRLTPQGKALPPPLRERFRRYFSAGDLEQIRIVEADPLPIPDPPLTWLVRRLGFQFPALSHVGGITFGHVIAVRGPVHASLLFHEMVHAVQYRQLGVRRFSRLYVRGFLATGDYEGIPLERCAYELESRFVLRRQPFDVDAAVEWWIENDRL